MLLELAFQRHTSCLREDERHPKRTGIIIFGCTNRKRGRTMNPADIAFIIICTGLVMLMTPGLALFYGGLVRSRNVLSTTMHSFITMGIVPVLWFVVGYSLAFGPDLGGIIGGFSHVLLRGVDMEPPAAFLHCFLCSSSACLPY
mgnify:CR=1 FL=1